MSHTYATLEVSADAFDEIAGKLRAAEYHHSFVGEVIDMHGIALTRAAVAADWWDHPVNFTWPRCNPGCDPEFGGERSKNCATLCEPAGKRIAELRSMATPQPAQQLGWKHPAPNAAVPAYPTGQAGSAGIASCGCTSWTDGLGGSGENKCAAHRAALDLPAVKCSRCGRHEIEGTACFIGDALCPVVAAKEPT